MLPHSNTIQKIQNGGMVQVKVVVAPPVNNWFGGLNFRGRGYWVYILNTIHIVWWHDPSQIKSSQVVAAPPVNNWFGGRWRPVSVVACSTHS